MSTHESNSNSTRNSSNSAFKYGSLSTYPYTYVTGLRIPKPASARYCTCRERRQERKQQQRPALAKTTILLLPSGPTSCREAKGKKKKINIVGQTETCLDVYSVRMYVKRNDATWTPTPPHTKPASSHVPPPLLAGTCVI